MTTSRSEIYGAAVRHGLLTLTEARIEMGTASWREVLGFRFPRIFPGLAAENARRDAKDREYHEATARLRREIAAWGGLR
jgi:hypothetical protein